MKKRILSLMLAACMICGMPTTIHMRVFAITNGTFGVLSDIINNNQVTITKFDNLISDIIISSEIAGLPVVKIDDAAFDCCHNLSTIQYKYYKSIYNGKQIHTH